MKAPMGKAIMQKYHPDQDERGRVAPMNEDNGGDYYLVTDVDAEIALMQKVHGDIRQDYLSECNALQAKAKEDDALIEALRLSVEFASDSRLQQRIKELEADALVMALRLLGEDDNSFGPECHEVMNRWGKIAMKAFNGA